MSRRRILLGTVLSVLFALGWWAGGSHAARGLYTGLDLFVEVLETVKANYVDPVETGKLVTGAMRGVAHGLDPWSRYLDPEEFRAVRGTIQGAFDGIGASVDQRGGWPVVIAPIEGSPAWDAGVQPGDIITKVDGRSTFGLSPDEVSAKLRGAAGTHLVLTVAREESAHGVGDGDVSEKTIELTRRRVTVKNVPYAFIAAPGVGYVRLAHFSAHAAADVASAVDSLRGAGARALVLDLRGNPGGTIDESVAIAGQFLPAGARVTSTAGRATGASRDYDAKAARAELGWPLAVLVDGGSASASEIVAGALQDHDRAVLVGDTTFGKGVAQQIYPLRTSLGALQLTVSRYLTPSGRSIQRERLMAAASDDEGEDDAEPGVARDSVPGSARTYRTNGGRVVRAGMGLAPDVHVAADSSLARVRYDSHHPGGVLGAARAALTRDPVFLRALEVLQHSADARGVFAAAGLKAPAAGGARR
ncbi:MAG: S41 family peptidase [Candidatus Eisenbacteria bacterium]